MFLMIDENGSLSLQEVEDLKSFSVVEAQDASEKAKASSAISHIAEPAEDNHYWIDADAVIQMSSMKDDKQWVDSFWEMLDKVAPYGYYDAATKRVKAHVETR